MNLSSATQNAKPPQFGGKRTTFMSLPLPTLLYAVYSGKQKNDKKGELEYLTQNKADTL